MPIVRLRVGRQDFRVTCEAGEEDMMNKAAARVEREMGEARTRFRAADGERAATMAALRVAFDAERAEKKKWADLRESGGEQGRIHMLSARIRAVLARTGSPQERDGT